MKKTIYILAIVSLYFFTIQAQEKVDSGKQQTLQKDGIDPVCGMKVKKGTSIISIHEEKEYGFCSKMCKGQFDKNPKKFIKK